MEGSNWVFISHSYDNWWDKISEQTVCGMLKKYRNVIKGKKFSCHTLRHSFATKLLESWVDLYSIKNLLGHSDISITQRYLHRTDKKLESIQNKVFGMF